LYICHTVAQGIAALAWRGIVTTDSISTGKTVSGARGSEVRIVLARG